MKPAFIPLIGKYFDQFDAGTKDRELRRVGRQWQAKNFPVGRQVTLSRGYNGKRLAAVVIEAKEVSQTALFPDEQVAVKGCYPDIKPDELILIIKLKVVR